MRGTAGDCIASGETFPARLVLQLVRVVDRRHKGSLYARAGVADYWIVNLVDRVLEVYRDPGLDPSAPYGWRHQSVETRAPPVTVRPLVIASAPIRVADRLP